MDENQAVEQTRNELAPLVGNILMNDLIHISVTSIPFKLIITRERLVAIFLYIRQTQIVPLFRPHITFPHWRPCSRGVHLTLYYPAYSSIRVRQHGTDSNVLL